MKLPVLAILVGALPNSWAFSVASINRKGQLSIERHGSSLFMSDSQPSDSATQDLVDVESESFTPSAGEVIVTSLLDDLPLELSGEVSKETRSKINEALLQLEKVAPQDDATTSPLLNGVWSLRYAGGYSSEWALTSPTRQLALFLYSGGYSPGLYALSLAQNLPTALCETGDLTITISRDQPRIEANIGVKFFSGAENEVSVKARLDVESTVRLREAYESASVFGQNVEIPESLQYSRDLMVTYVDEDVLIVRDASGVPEILVRKEYGA